MPWPAQVAKPATEGALTLDNRLTINVNGDDLGDAVTRWRWRISRQTGWTAMKAIR